MTPKEANEKNNIDLDLSTENTPEEIENIFIFPEKDTSFNLYRRFYCFIHKIISYNKDKNYLTVILKDYNGTSSLGFIYSSFAKLLDSIYFKIRNLFPLPISIIKGEFKRTAAGKGIMEIYHLTYQNYFFINSSALGPHEFCSMQTYLNIYLGMDSEPNIHLLWGNILHDFLSNAYSSKEDLRSLYKISDKKLKDRKINSHLLWAFVKACFDNSKLIYILKEDMDHLTESFILKFLDNERIYMKNFLKEYGKAIEKGETEIYCEKSVRSRLLGIQGRIDRLILDRKNKNVNVIETKTGMATTEAQTRAYYQVTAYATILSEYYREYSTKLTVEFPKSPAENRFSNYDYNPRELLRIIKNRNEIWAISYGTRPEFGPYRGCSRCYLKPKCELMCYAHNVAHNMINCGKHPEKCSTYNKMERDGELKEIFHKFLSYFKWHLLILDKEFIQNVKRLEDINQFIGFRRFSGQNIEIGQNLNDPTIIENQSDGGLYFIFDRFITIEEDDPVLTNRNTALFKIKMVHRSISNNINHNPMQTGADSGNNDYLEDDFKGLSDDIATGFREGDFIVLVGVTNENGIAKNENIEAIIQNIEQDGFILQSYEKKEEIIRVLGNSQIRIYSSVSHYINKIQRTALSTLLTGSFIDFRPNLVKLRNILLFNHKPKVSRIIKDDIINKITANKYYKMLDESQKEALKGAIRARDLFLIQGPPGTGKSTVIANITKASIELYKMKKKLYSKRSLVYYSDQARYPDANKIIPVMITAFTNFALDTLILKIIKMFPELKLVRLGTNVLDDPEIKTRTLNESCRTYKVLEDGHSIEGLDPEKIKDAIENAQIIACTTSMAASSILNKVYFDTIILDEGGQISESSAIIPLLKGDKYVIVGDHLQLPPISSISIGEGELDDATLSILRQIGYSPPEYTSQSLFERLIKRYRKNTSYRFLSYQYRMNRKISDFVSKTLYDGLLKCGNIDGHDVGEQSIADLLVKYELNIALWKSKPFISFVLNPEKSLILIDSSNCKFWDSNYRRSLEDPEAGQPEKANDNNATESRYNKGHLEIISTLFRQLLEPLIEHAEINDRDGEKQGGTHIINKKMIIQMLGEIGIISPYRAQNYLIRQTLRRLFIDLNLISADDGKNNNKEDIFGDLIIDTVDRFQGSEREIIIFDSVDSNPDFIFSKLLYDLRRFNVAITRAKKKVILIADSKTLSHLPSISGSNKDDEAKAAGLNGTDELGNENNAGLIKAKRFYTELINYISELGGYYDYSNYCRES